ncbi:MAG: hypothetical protein CME62_00590 [Halobacteriovoraceae bacterium]|nr:hypothetical protein [Halobacteriovoraceae bacterium]|tara:strand:+ start:3876 stop:6938 length:3063 start_codon:yes stop_codon:yes gene_type:complete
MKKLIAYFFNRPLLTNIIFILTMGMAIFAWKNFVSKEEMPEFASNWVRINISYPGAAAEDVELFVTKPLEDELKGVVGIKEVQSTSSVGSSSFRIVIDDNYPDSDEVVKEIKDATLRVNYPSEVRDLPSIRQFKSSEKAIMDLGFYHKGYRSLDVKGRQELQQAVLNFENQLTALPEISSVTRSHYLKPELQILVSPETNNELELSLTEILNQIRNNHIRVPIGSLQDQGESKITALNEYENVESFNELILRGNYEGNNIKLAEISKIQDGFERSNSIFKINGHEAVFLNIRKSISTDIITAQEKVKNFIDQYKKDKPDSQIGIAMMDDESYAVRNRLSIISSNGLIGFVLIMLVLLVFLNFKTGFWVAMGIPFSMSFTLLIAHLYGYTVNNMTLAGIIIVLGIVVDDAIIIAENIMRKKEEGLSLKDACVEGSYEVWKPITASIITTCVAFVPLLFFEGFFGKLVSYIPLIVILMLLGSLIESLFILPAHLNSKEKLGNEKTETWFHPIERKYERFLKSCIKGKVWVFLSLILFLAASSFVFINEMSYVMFPREESEEVVIKVTTPKGSDRFTTSQLIYPLEEIILKEKENVVAIRSSIAMSRRGGNVRENEASVLVEVYPLDERTEPLSKLISRWEKAAAQIEGLEEVKFLKGRWGNDSGSAVEVQVQENNDENRSLITQRIKTELEKLESIKEVEIDDPLIKNEFLFKINQSQLIKLNVDPMKLTTALRTYVEGSIAYSINKGEEEIDVRVSVPDKTKDNIKDLLMLFIENKNGQLIRLDKMVSIEQVQRPVSIQRDNFKRSTMVYGDLKEKAQMTPLDIADYIEQNIFPPLKRDFPNVIFSFKGEIEDTRESQGEFFNSIILVIILIYFILVVMFDSFVMPLIVLSSVPFGVSAVVWILMAHGMSIYGFFAIIGALGMIGVVVNDSIVMIDKILNDTGDNQKTLIERITSTASTRLRPIIVTTLTTVVGVLPTAYGIAGYDSMLAEMMLVMGWGLLIATLITLLIVPCLMSIVLRD